jgi:hypothetical protein
LSSSTLSLLNTVFYIKHLENIIFRTLYMQYKSNLLAKCTI